MGTPPLKPSTHTISSTAPPPPPKEGKGKPGWARTEQKDPTQINTIQSRESFRPLCCSRLQQRQLPTPTTPRSSAYGLGKPPKELRLHEKKRLATCMCCLPPSLHLIPPAPSQSSVPKLAISFSEKAAVNSGVSPSSVIQCFFRPGSNDDVARSSQEEPRRQEHHRKNTPGRSPSFAYF
ncbi:hypothetical protein K456DRAFT_546066 [Colletotrichum gloeosporioides 23]|nr:hypothetical protein K456DRAFT_546066 [Colletotrichum gloeosporioides 23]